MFQFQGSGGFDLKHRVKESWSCTKSYYKTNILSRKDKECMIEDYYDYNYKPKPPIDPYNIPVLFAHLVIN